MTDLSRYHRQMLLPGIGEAGQRALTESHALIVGCGALGTIITDTLARAGVGRLTIVDRDIVELTNLQRQILFDERDVEEGLPKAEAARRKITRINSQIEVHAIVEDFNHSNAEHIARDADIFLDGLDNFATRYLLNDLSVKHGVPYLYGGAVGTTGMACAFIPIPLSEGEGKGGGAGGRHDERSTHALTPSLGGRGDGGPCLRCIFPEAPPPGTTPTCDTAGVLAGAVAMIAHHQAAQAIKILTAAARSENLDAVDCSLITLDIWANEFRRLDVSAARDLTTPCPCCVQRKFEHLEGAVGSSATSLCGRSAVQINPRVTARDGAAHEMNLAHLAARLASHGEFNTGEFLLRGRFARERGDGEKPIEITVFPDGRAIIAGTARPDLARAIYDKYIGG